MNIVTKDATIQNTGPDDEFPGTFQVILSTPTKDREGEEVKSEEWQQPLPDHITFDTDHGMSVATTVGSGKPTLDTKGNLIVEGTYSSLPRAQELRTLVNEGHIRSTSVAFSRHTKTDPSTGKKTVTRELLNGAFAAVPVNPEARVLASKAGMRNSASDQRAIQAAHDATVEAGAVCAGPEDDSGAEEGAVGGKSAMTDDAVTKAKYDTEQLRQMLAAGHAIENANGEPSYPIGDEADLENAIRAVGRGGAGHDKIRAYIIRRAKELGTEDKIPANWSPDGSLKALSGAFTKALNLTPPEAASDVTRLAQAADAALDEAMNFLDGIDKTDMPETVAQAIDLSTAGWVAVRALMDALHAYDPDADQQTTTDEGGSRPDAKSVAAVALDMQYRITEALANAEAI